MSPRRRSSALRAVAAAAALSVAAAGGGVPMCVSLIAWATAPCTMHTEHAGAAAHHFATATVNAAPSGDVSCHGDAQSAGCATGGVCPSGGSASPVSGARGLGVAAPDRTTVFAGAAAHASFVAPPLPPPPQA